MKRKKLIVAVWMIALSSFFSLNAYAGAPSGVDTGKLDLLTNVVFWLARIAIAASGGIPACQKIVQGKADENPKEMNAGISTLVITGAVFCATFGIQAILF